jgi:acyl-CoA thioester hydrolase
MQETRPDPFDPSDVVHAGLWVANLGNSSVRYEIGLFRNEERTASAHGYFIHVYLDRATRRAISLPADMRAALERIST